MNTFFQNAALIALIIALALYVLAVRLPTMRDAARRRFLFLISLWLSIGLLLPYLHTVFNDVSILVARYFVILLPAIFLLAAWSMAALKDLAGRGLALAVIGSLSLVPLFGLEGYYGRTSREPFREIADMMPHEGNILYLAPQYESLVLSYYLNKKAPGRWFHEANLETLREELPPLLESGSTTLWVVRRVHNNTLKNQALNYVLHRFTEPATPVIEVDVLNGRPYRVVRERIPELQALLQKPLSEWFTHRATPRTGDAEDKPPAPPVTRQPKE